MSEPLRWMDSRALAEYLCVQIGRIPRLVREGRIPKPEYFLGPRSPRWDRFALDNNFTNGVISTDAQTASDTNAQRLRTGGRQGPRRQTH